MYRRSKTAAVGLAILAAVACGGEAAEERATVQSASQEQPTATEAPAVTTAEDGVRSVDVCRGSGVVWEPGATYTLDCFLVPVSFDPVDDGWRTTGAAADRALITWADSGVPLAEVALLAYRPASSVDAVTEAILDIEGLTAVSDQRREVVAGSSAVTFDVVSSADPPPSPDIGWDECHSLSVGVKIAPDGGPGWRLLESGGLSGEDDYGFSPCRVFRVWVVDVAGSVITVLAAAETELALTEAMPRIERLLSSVTFGSA